MTEPTEDSEDFHDSILLRRQKPCEGCEEVEIENRRVVWNAAEQEWMWHTHCLVCEGLVKETRPCTFCRRWMERLRSVALPNHQEADLCRRCIAAVDETYNWARFRPHLYEETDPMYGHAILMIETARRDEESKRRWTAVGNLVKMEMDPEAVHKAVCG